jgi:two-component sensor histidine kinase
LISNALKHAFPSGKIGGKIGVEIGRDEATAAYQLVVWDDGVGIPSEVDVEHTTSLGLQLVSSLARQLGGAITVHTSPGLGTRVVVYFSEPNDSKGA